MFRADLIPSHPLVLVARKRKTANIKRLPIAAADMQETLANIPVFVRDSLRLNMDLSHLFALAKQRPDLLTALSARMMNSNTVDEEWKMAILCHWLLFIQCNQRHLLLFEGLLDDQPHEKRGSTKC